ncbi:MAG: NBR1-Ig-like domain-containing protein, partial [Anaerolineaceae bacterium]
MKKKFFYPVVFTVIFVMILSACIPGFINNNQQSDGSQAATAAAQTLQAMETQVWVGTLQAELTRVAGQMSSEPTATQTVQPGQTQQEASPTQTAAPATNTPNPTATYNPPTATPTPCYWAQFVKDVTIPDGTEIDAGADFTKTWRLKNIGACAWNTGFDLVFSSGNAMDSPAAVDFPKTVQPGETVDVSVD